MCEEHKIMPLGRKGLVVYCGCHGVEDGRTEEERDEDMKKIKKGA